MELILENVRCFAERQTIPVKPLTLLVGENSAGKSTFLASIAAVSEQSVFPMQPHFSIPPYNLGNYDTIATYRGGRGGRAKSFSLGFKTKSSIDNDALQIIATYHDNKGAVEISQFRVLKPAYDALFSFTTRASALFSMTSNPRREEQIYDIDRRLINSKSPRQTYVELLFFAQYKLHSTKNEDFEAKSQTLDDIYPELYNELSVISLETTISIAPIRTKPKRTYDEVVEEFSPEGEHVPFVLDDVLQDASNRAVLENFGKESGLFSKVAVKQWGKKRSDPLQVMVTNEGRPASSAANLVDVGYGVSQALPLVVQSLLAAPESRLLLQQPEVHLHPRAQAALGTLFVDLLASTKKQFVVETHSDYILDRVRQEVAKGRVPASDVGILYFEREKNGTRVYPIELDDVGSIVNAPPSYRSFFLREEINLLTRANRNGARK